MTIGVAGTVSPLGVGWKWQDNTKYTYDTAGGGGDCAAGDGSHYMDLDDYRGIMTWESYSANGSCYSNVYVQGSYEHTWDNSGVQSLSIGVGPGNNFAGFNYGVTSSSYFPSQSYGSDNSVDPLC